MRMIIVESAIKARTIWAAFNDPEGTVVCPLDPEFAGLKPKTPADETNGFGPVWGLLNERAFRSLARQARKAHQIILAQSDDWLVSITEEMLRSSGITAPIIRVRFDDLHVDAIKRDVGRIIPVDRNAVARAWRRKTADRIAADAICKTLKKAIGVDWSPTLEAIRMFRQISEANRLDKLSGVSGAVQIDPSNATVCGALVRLSETNHPSVVAQEITDLMDYGLLSLASQQSVERLDAFCVQNLAVKTQAINCMGMLLPMNAETDLQVIQPSYRATYTNIWSYAVRTFVPAFKVPPFRPLTTYQGLAARFLCWDGLERAATLNSLREAGLIFGWSYIQLTETGVLVDSLLRATWPLLSDPDFIVEALRNVDDTKVPREDAIGAVKSATVMTRDVEMPVISTLCPACRGELKVLMNQKRLRLACQESTCSRVWPVEQDGQALRPLLDHEAPRWCDQDGVTMHQIALDPTTQSTRQTCKACSRQTTH